MQSTSSFDKTWPLHTELIVLTFLFLGETLERLTSLEYTLGLGKSHVTSIAYILFAFVIK